MKIFERARDLILNPKVTWQVIKDETVDIKKLIVDYAAVLALVPAVSSLLGLSIIGIRISQLDVVRAPLFTALLGAIVGYALNLAMLFVGAWLIKFLAPHFGSKPDMNRAMKLVVFSMTPAWLAGVFSIIPGLSILTILGLYGIYLLALGMPILLETPPDKVVWYALSVLAIAMIINIILSMLLFSVIYSPMYMQMMTGY